MSVNFSATLFKVKIADAENCECIPCSSLAAMTWKRRCFRALICLQIEQRRGSIY